MTVTLEYADHDELLAKCAAILETAGWIVVPADNLRMETPREVALRFGLTSSALCMRLKRFRGQFIARKGESGRIRHLHVTPELEAFLQTK